MCEAQEYGADLGRGFAPTTSSSSASSSESSELREGGRLTMRCGQIGDGPWRMRPIGDAPGGGGCGRGECGACTGVTGITSPGAAGGAPALLPLGGTNVTVAPHCPQLLTMSPDVSILAGRQTLVNVAKAALGVCGINPDPAAGAVAAAAAAAGLGCAGRIAA